MRMAPRGSCICDCSTVGGNRLGRIRRSITRPFPVSSFLYPYWEIRCKHSGTASVPACLPAAMLPTMMVMDSPSETKQAPINSSVSVSSKPQKRKTASKEQGARPSKAEDGNGKDGLQQRSQLSHTSSPRSPQGPVLGL